MILEVWTNVAVPSHLQLVQPEFEGHLTAQGLQIKNFVCSLSTLSVQSVYGSFEFSLFTEALMQFVDGSSGFYSRMT